MAISSIKFITDDLGRIKGVEDGERGVSERFTENSVPDKYILNPQQLPGGDSVCEKSVQSITARKRPGDTLSQTANDLRHLLDSPGINNNFYYVGTMIDACRRADRVKILKSMTSLEQARIIIAYSEYATAAKDVETILNSFSDAKAIIENCYVLKKINVAHGPNFSIDRWVTLFSSQIELQDKIGLFHTLGSFESVRPTKTNTFGLKEKDLIRQTFEVYDRTYSLDHYTSNPPFSEIVVRSVESSAAEEQEEKNIEGSKSFVGIPTIHDFF